jgi:hypothetical protein
MLLIVPSTLLDRLQDQDAPASYPSLGNPSPDTRHDAGDCYHKEQRPQAELEAAAW